VTDRPRRRVTDQEIEEILAEPSVQRAAMWMMTHPPGARLPEGLDPGSGHGACHLDPETGLHLAWCVAAQEEL
jgi:hypothetical protein